MSNTLQIYRFRVLIWKSGVTYDKIVVKTTTEMSQTREPDGRRKGIVEVQL